MKTISVCVCVLLLGSLARASTVSEFEPNDTFGSAMSLPVGVTRVDAEMLAGDLVGGILVDGDVDYFVFNGLPAGMPFVAHTMSQNPTVDTLLGLFGSGGLLLQLSDDAPGGTGLPALSSILQGIVPPSGSLPLGVTGYPDSGFLGSHPEHGLYSLEISIVPEPTSIALCLTLFSMFLARARNRH